MAFEQCTELLNIVRLQQDPPVIAGIRFVFTNEQKWYHGNIARLLIGEDGFFVIGT